MNEGAYSNELPAWSHGRDYTFVRLALWCGDIPLRLFAHCTLNGVSFLSPNAS
jgi:hypothetical protein